jgi:DNA-directed RNA polymerase specialized sigma24 family protein
MTLDTGSSSSTHWSSIYRAAESEQQAGDGALNALLLRYYPTLLSYVRSGFHLPEDDACDLVQGFVEHKVLLQRLLRSARPERGRFRGFLRTSLHRYVIDQLRSRQGPVRRPEGGLVSFQDATDLVEGVSAREGPDSFDRAWALNVIDQAERATESFYVEKDRADTWGVFRDGVLQPLRDGVERPSDEELARRHGLKSARQASNAIITVKRQFGKILREVIRSYLEIDEDVDQELRELMAVLSKG